ncbi:MAG TPA: hypothetical protein H9903_03505 [Candidatus Aquabacterium excrementipullorum]|nr:hypothetical protein [Candidatus Aquabacterium excrementipullorum]
MGTLRTVKIDVDGLKALVSVNEVTPGRWAWKVVFEGQPAIVNKLPAATEQGAVMAAIDAVRQHERIAH